MSVDERFQGGRPHPDLLQQWVQDERLSAVQVGHRLGLSRAATYAWLRRYGIARDGPRIAQAELTAAWRGGEFVAELAARIGLAPAAVRERLVAAAVLDLPRRYFIVGSPDDPLPEELLRQWYVRQGFSAEQVGALTDTTARQVRYRLRRYRLSRARPGPPARLRRRLPADELRRLYVDQQMSCPQIAARVGASAEAIRELLAAAGITRRPSGLAGADGRAPLDEARLRLLYVEQGKSLASIARELGYLTRDGNPAVRRVRAALERAGLASRRGANWSTRMRVTADGTRTAGDVDDATLHRLYTEQGLTVAEVADRLGWRTPAGKAATTYTRQRLRAAGVVLRGPGPSRR